MRGSPLGGWRWDPTHGDSSPRALALNCSAPINDRKGAEAKDWRSGKPVRVVRNVKGRKHSKYAPAEGNRYDGIYKVNGRPPAGPALLPAPPQPTPPCSCWPRPRRPPLGFPTGGAVLAREGQVRLSGMALSPAEG